MNNAFVEIDGLDTKATKRNAIAHQTRHVRTRYATAAYHHLFTYSIIVCYCNSLQNGTFRENQGVLQRQVWLNLYIQGVQKNAKQANSSPLPMQIGICTFVGFSHRRKGALWEIFTGKDTSTNCFWLYASDSLATYGAIEMCLD